MAKHACEICGDTVKKPQPASKCSHTVHLCETCKRTCPGATEWCVKCENKGW